MQEMQVQSLGQEDLLEKGMATHSRTLAWKIPRTEEPGGLHSWGCKELDTAKQLHSIISMSNYTNPMTLILPPCRDQPNSGLLYQDAKFFGFRSDMDVN